MKRLLLLAAFAALSACHHAPQPVPATATAATDVGAPARQTDLGPAVYTGDRRPAVFPDDWPYPAGHRAVFAEHAIVASDAPLASQAGVEIMRRGGNAVDAAVAVGFALAVVYPEAGNLGGGGYMVIHMADGRTAAIDFREMAPLAATHDMYLDASGKPTDRSIVGPLASGVPGTVAGLVAAQAKYGSMSLAQVMAPAIRYAEQGFVVDSAFARSLAGNAPLIARYAGASVFLPGGKPLPAGSVLRQPDLARTLRRIAEHGAEGFYHGETARLVAAEEKQIGGIITEADLAHYAPAWRDPIRSTYRGYTLLTMPPSSSGGVTITESLNILEGFGALPPFGSTAYTHELASAYQRAFVDRNEKIADPAFYPVPIAQLTSKSYASSLRATIAPDHATPTSEVMQRMHGASAAGSSEGTETTHFSVADPKGDAVAMTYTLNALYGSGVFIPGAGFFMNDEMDDFATKPGAPNMFGLVQGEANAVAPGKRPLSAMSPTIVLDRDGKLLLAVGSRGGPRIITSTSQVILNVLAHHMILSDAVSAPRIHDQSLPDKLLYEQDGLADAVVDSLQHMGWTVSAIGGVGLVNAVMKVPGGYEGMSDPRSAGQPVGY